MAGRGWDDPWRKYPPSVPMPVDGGHVTSRSRGPMATAWWSRRFVEVLESYGLGARMQRGRRYARAGQVVEIDVSPGIVAAQVQGSRPRPYLVTVSMSMPTDAQWEAVIDAMRQKVGFAARLLDGEVPADLEGVFAGTGLTLFPEAWTDLQSRCSCPDWENPCKHIAAVLYLLADRLDSDPWLALLLRGRSRDVLMAALVAGGASRAAEPEIAPWWPFGPGPVPVGAATDSMAGVRTGPPDAVFDTMEPLAVQVGPDDFAEVLRSAYRHWLGP